MKKILALALVLVLALGMMVPATAATKAKFSSTTLSGNPIDSTDLNPGDSITLKLDWSDFGMNDEAVLAIASARNYSSLKSVLKKIADTAEPRFRARSGGKVFDSIEVDSVTVPNIFDIPSGGGVRNRIALAVNAAGNGAYDGTNVGWAALKAAYDAKPTTLTNAELEALWAAYLEEVLAFVVINVVLDTVDPFVSVNDVDYEVDVYFLIDGTRTDPIFYWTLIGNFANEVTEVDNDTYDVDSYKGQVIEATEYVSKIAICGNYEYDINANVKMAKDKKIYFYVVTESDSSDESIFDKYPAIEVAFKVYQVGLNAYTGNFISLDGVDSTYYVYGKDSNGALKYLGRGGEMLPLSSKYYISTSKLDIVDENIDEDLPSDTDTVPEDSYNPSTGI